VAAAAGVLANSGVSVIPIAALFLGQRFNQIVGSSSTYETVQAPPATVFLHALHFQIPTECRLTVFFPQKVQVYRACWVISIFLTCFRREAPYLREKG
jgi:hypothetical protein